MMTEYEGDEDEVVETADLGSLARRVSDRRSELVQQRTVILDVPGYVNVLAAEYRLLTWPTIRKLAQRHKKVRDEGVRELYVAADTLILACEQVIEVREDGSHRPTGHRWSVEFAQILGIDTLPENPTSRQAILAIFGVDSRLIVHYSEYVEWQQGEGIEVDQEVMSGLGTTG